MLELTRPSGETHSRPAVDHPDASSTGQDPHWEYFGMGHLLQLADRPGVFRLSPAGRMLGALLVQRLTGAELRGRFLELGTGSGALALLLRSLGASEVTATDVSASAVQLAVHNERLNFTRPSVRFAVGDLFAPLTGGESYHCVVFNPPGWRDPSRRFVEALRRTGPADDLGLSAMFHGDRVVVEFLTALPRWLHHGGRAYVGLNSMIGIRDVLDRYHRRYDGPAPLRLRLLERHSFPLLLYTDSWRALEPLLRTEFRRWRDDHGAAFQEDDGVVHWSYEIIECTHAGSAETSGA